MRPSVCTCSACGLAMTNSIQANSLEARSGRCRVASSIALRRRARLRVQGYKPTFFAMRKNGCQLHASAPGCSRGDCGAEPLHAYRNDRVLARRPQISCWAVRRAGGLTFCPLIEGSLARGTATGSTPQLEMIVRQHAELAATHAASRHICATTPSTSTVACHPSRCSDSAGSTAAVNKRPSGGAATRGCGTQDQSGDLALIVVWRRGTC